MTQSTENTQFRWPFRIYYEDTDVGGIVYHANYLKYFERARTEWMRHIDILDYMANQTQTMFVAKSAQVDYHQPAKLDDEIIVTTNIEKLGRASVIFFQEAWRGDQCLVGGRFKIGCVDVQTIRPCAIPPHVIQKIQAAIQTNATPSKIYLVPT